MIDHVGIRVKDLAKSRAFYQATLKALGYRILREVTPEQTGGDAVVGFGSDQPFFWVHHNPRTLGSGHVAFAAKDRKSVDAFHAAALAAGGEDFGAPGLRAHYHPNFYGAFVLDPDGNNIEAVCHRPQ